MFSLYFSVSSVELKETKPSVPGFVGDYSKQKVYACLLKVPLRGLWGEDLIEIFIPSKSPR
jgi:hypothetical protein